MHGLSPFSNKFAIKFFRNSICSRRSANGDIKNGSTEFSELSSVRVIFVLFYCCCVIFNVSYWLIPIVQTYWFVCEAIFYFTFAFYWCL